VADGEKLKLGKGVAFVKARLKRLPQGDDAWEADFQALPSPIMQSETHYLGLVVTREGGSLLADLPVHGRPSVNDLATLLAHAMRRPLDGDARRPKLVRLRGHHQWRELFPVLQELGVEVSVERKLPAIEKAYRDYLRRLRDEQRAGMTKPSAEQAEVGPGDRLRRPRLRGRHARHAGRGDGRPGGGAGPVVRGTGRRN
jgi:hypothetical protein